MLVVVMVCGGGGRGGEDWGCLEGGNERERKRCAEDVVEGSGGSIGRMEGVCSAEGTLSSKWLWAVPIIVQLLVW